MGRDAGVEHGDRGALSAEAAPPTAARADVLDAPGDGVGRQQRLDRQPHGANWRTGCGCRAPPGLRCRGQTDALLPHRPVGGDGSTPSTASSLARARRISATAATGSSPVSGSSVRTPV